MPLFRVKAIGNFAGVDRSYVFMFSSDGTRMSKTNEWCAEGIKPLINRAQQFPVDSIPWMGKRLKGLEVVHIPDVSQLTGEAAMDREEFRRAGIKSLVGVPIMSGFSALGFIGFDSVTTTKTWTEQIIALLKIVGEMFAYSLSRKQAAEALEVSESRYRALYECANDAIFIIQGDKVVDCNNKMLSMFGWERKDVIGHSPYRLTPPDGYDERDLAHLLERLRGARAGDPQFFEAKCRRSDKSTFDAEISLNTVSVGTETILQGIIRDITRRKQAEEELERTFSHLQTAIGATIRVIAQVVETKDPYTAGHQRRTASLACAIATEMRLPLDTVEGIHMAGVIHDIGKVSVPAEILSKPGRLSLKEFELIKDHPQIGYEILKDVTFPWPIAAIILQHHERLDGSGYPQGLSGDDICIESRILTVADVVEAIASHRPYRPGLGITAALEEISKNRSRLYDPHVVDACLAIFQEKGFQFE
ncbi:MAG TPA: PAS domain S-box protein [Deltaproteobacteria bacterium]|nr:PAS domain S-box protein [Deltaproteobacteria bacterium]